MKVNKVTACAMLACLTFVLQILSGLLTGVLPFSLSLTLIPIAVAAYYFGVGASTSVGAAFGLAVLVQCVTGLDQSGVLLFQQNPIACSALTFGRGALVGLVCGLCTLGNAKPNRYVFPILTPIVNTGIFILGFMLCYYDTLVEWAGGTGNVIAFVFIGLVGINFLIEEALNLVLFPPITKALDKVRIK